MSPPYAEVIGDPIAHSKSPLIHNHWLARLGIRAEYRATRIPPDELSGYLQVRRGDTDWRGSNVTIPHKEAALDDVGSLDASAEAVGALNCIVPCAAGLVGYNTDVEGVAAALAGLSLENQKIAVVGGGGAARAALNYLARREVSAINVLVRNPQRAQKLKLLAKAGIVDVGSIDDASRLLDGAAVVINASPLGMRGFSQMPHTLLAAVREQPSAALFDMVYDPPNTAFLSQGRAQRIDGLSMLVGQAARAFELFFGTRAPSADGELRDLLSSPLERTT